jgi:hypothetical protein
MKLTAFPSPHLAQNSRMKIISEPPLPIEVYTISQNLSLEEVRPPALLISFSFISRLTVGGSISEPPV